MGRLKKNRAKQMRRRQTTESEKSTTSHSSYARKVLVFVPVYRHENSFHLTKQFYNSWRPTLPAGWTTALEGYHHPDVANLHMEAIRLGIENRCDWVVLVGADSWPDDPTTVWRMIAEAPEDAALIGAAVPCKGGHYDVQIVDGVALRPGDVGAEWLNGGIQQVPIIGSGLTAYRPEAFRDLDMPWFARSWDKKSQSITSFAYDTCRRLCSDKWHAYVDWRVRVWHRIGVVYRATDGEEMMEAS